MSINSYLSAARLRKRMPVAWEDGMSTPLSKLSVYKELHNPIKLSLTINIKSIEQLWSQRSHELMEKWQSQNTRMQYSRLTMTHFENEKGA